MGVSSAIFFFYIFVLFGGDFSVWPAPKHSAEGLASGPKGEQLRRLAEKVGVLGEKAALDKLPSGTGQCH